MLNTDTVNLFLQQLINLFPKIRVWFLKARFSFWDYTLFIVVNWLKPESGLNIKMPTCNNICIKEDIIYLL